MIDMNVGCYQGTDVGYREIDLQLFSISCAAAGGFFALECAAVDQYPQILI